MAAAKYVGAGLAAIGLTGAGRQLPNIKQLHTGTQSSGSDEFFKLVYGVDNGQETDNVFIIAKRFLESGEKPNLKIINKVFRLTGEEEVSDELVELFAEHYSERVTFNELPINRSRMETFRSLETEGKASGVYVFKHKETGELYVGSSINLVVRVRDHYYGRTHGRLAQHIKLNGPQNYTVSVTVLPTNLRTKTNILALEQYVLFLLNPSINFLKVVNSSHKMHTDEEIAVMREKYGHKMYVYHKGVLVYVFRSVHQCFTELGESNNFTSRVLKRAKGKYREDLFFTKTANPSAERNLMSFADFKLLFEAVKTADKRVQAMPSNTQAVATTRNGVTVVHKSLSAVTTWLERETGKKCTRVTLTKTYLDTGKQYEGYKLERVHLDHPGYIVSESGL